MMDRHNGGIQCTFLDMAIRHVDIKQVYKLKWHKSFDKDGAYTLASGWGGDDWHEWLRKYPDY